MQQAVHVDVIIPTLENPDVVDIFLDKTDEENALPKQRAPDDKTDEGIEVEKANPLPLNTMQVDPSRSNKEENTMIDG